MSARSTIQAKADYEWHYTRETLEQIYDDFSKNMSEGECSEEDGWLAMTAGYALDFMNLAQQMPNSPKELNLVGPSDQMDVSLVAAFAALVFQEEGPDEVRAKLAKMVASYEFFTTMNTLHASEIDFDYRIDESGIVIRAAMPDGESLEINLLTRAKFAMSRSFLPDAGDEPNAGIGLGPLYRKLRNDFVLPLLGSYIQAEEELEGN